LLSLPAHAALAGKLSPVKCPHLVLWLTNTNDAGSQVPGGLATPTGDANKDAPPS